MGHGVPRRSVREEETRNRKWCVLLGPCRGCSGKRMRALENGGAARAEEARQSRGGGAGDSLLQLDLDAVERHDDEDKGDGDEVARLAAVLRGDLRVVLLGAEVDPVRREEDGRDVDEREAEEP